MSATNTQKLTIDDVYLEEISWEHYDDLRRITSIGSVMRWIADQKVWTDEKLRRFIEYSIEEQKQPSSERINYYSAIMVRVGEQACVGVVGIHPVTYKSGKGELSASDKFFMTIFVDEEFHRRGIASAAIRIALERFAQRDTRHVAQHVACARLRGYPM